MLERATACGDLRSRVPPGQAPFPPRLCQGGRLRRVRVREAVPHRESHWAPELLRRHPVHAEQPQYRAFDRNRRMGGDEGFDRRDDSAGELPAPFYAPAVDSKVHGGFRSYAKRRESRHFPRATTASRSRAGLASRSRAPNSAAESPGLSTGWPRSARSRA